MGVDYVIDLDCAAKGEHGVDGLLELLKQRGMIDVMVADLRRRGSDEPLEKMTVTRVLRTPEGDRETSISIADMLASTAPLDEMRPACLDCPANRKQDGFGCFGYINYPISEAAERWLLSRLPESIDAPAMYLLKSAIADFDYSGAPSARMRAAGDTFFTVRTAPSKTWGKKRLFRGYELEISTDQLFHLMFHVGTIEPMHAAMICVFFGLLPFDAIKNGELVENPKLQIPDESSAAQLAQFLLALAYASAHELTVSVSA